MAFEEKIKEHEERTRQAMAMGGPEKLERRRASGVLNARERIDLLFDPGTWREAGLFGTSHYPDMAAETPADGKVTGYGDINGRKAGVVAYDFTVKGSSSSATNNKKMTNIKEVAPRRGFPVVYLNESTGVRMPDIMGGRGMGGINDATRLLRKRESPWAAAVFGYAFGSAAWHAVISDFTVIRKGAVMAVSSPQLVEMATRQQIDPQDLGGWRLHAQVTGFADHVADTDEEAVASIRHFLSYLPSHNNEAPPRAAVPDGTDEAGTDILDLIPESPNQVYDMRRILEAVVDRDTLFELKPRFGKSLVTALARVDGRTVGIIASNPVFKGGAIDNDACSKATSALVLFDSYNIPILFFVDQPGFLVGLEAERQGIVGSVVNWMNALSLCTVPKITVLMRKSYGQAYINMGAGGTSDAIAAWWTADISFMDPSSGVTIVHGVRKEDDPKRFVDLIEDMGRAGSAYDLASVYGCQEVIDPRDTRAFLISMLDVHELRRTNGVGEHLMSAWPTSH
jgi:methylmalonyl-CoA decarboxylase subunit alpha